MGQNTLAHSLIILAFTLVGCVARPTHGPTPARPSTSRPTAISETATTPDPLGPTLEPSETEKIPPQAYTYAGTVPVPDFPPGLDWLNTERLQSLYEKLPDFRHLLRDYDPQGKFRNAFLDRYIFGAH